MAWSASAIFQQAMKNPMTASLAGTSNVTLPTGYSATGGLVADTVNVALFNNTSAPDKTAAVGLTGYNAGSSAWVTGNEVTSSTQWPAGGVALTSTSYSLDTGSSSFVYHAASASGSGTVTLAGFYGCLVYDTSISGGTVSKQGMCFNYFGGTQTVTAGTFTLIWATVGATTGVFNITV